MSQSVVTPAAPPAPAAAAAPAAAPLPPGRLMSLDIFRGITIAGMLLVNNPGTWSHIYAPLRHAEWHGWTPTDLIFPFFLFIAGVAMTYSFGKLKERGAASGELFARNSKRAGKIFLLGLVLASYPWWSYDYAQLRIPGVLQRIAVVVFLVAPIVLWTSRRTQAWTVVALLAGYWLAMRFIPVPGSGAGVWEPGQDLGAYLDRLVFTTDHLWSQSKTWDPEGLLSTLPALGTALLGVLTGDWIRTRNRDANAMLLGLFLAGAALMVAGGVWGWAFPINKALWTSSYVLFTAGMGMQALAACYWLVDVKGYQRWGFPFLLFGVNAIASYFLSSFVARLLGWFRVGDTTAKGWLYGTLFEPFLAPKLASLAFALAYVGVWMLFALFLYRRRIFIKV